MGQSGTNVGGKYQPISCNYSLFVNPMRSCNCYVWRREGHLLSQNLKILAAS